MRLGGGERITMRIVRRIYACACRMAGNSAEAEDLTQEAILDSVAQDPRQFRCDSLFFHLACTGLR